MSLLEAILSRGDRRLTKVIFCAFKQGARFDGAQNYFRFDYWREAFRESGVDMDFYLRARSKDEILPWDF